MKWYIAGPISSNLTGYKAEFAAAAAKLKAEGFDVINPAENPPQPSWEAYMKVSLGQLVTADGIALLPRWQRSKGATLEAHIADELGMVRMLLP